MGNVRDYFQNELELIKVLCCRYSLPRINGASKDITVGAR